MGLGEGGSRGALRGTFSLAIRKVRFSQLLFVFFFFFLSFSQPFSFIFSVKVAGKFSFWFVFYFLGVLLRFGKFV